MILKSLLKTWKSIDRIDEMLNLIGAQDVSCSIHESDVTTSIAIKSNAIESPGFYYYKVKASDN